MTDYSASSNMSDHYYLMTSDEAENETGTDETPIHDAETDGLRGTVIGLQGFRDNWQHDVDMPHQMMFSGWQMSDDEHPAESGKPGYRLVHKTIRTVPFPAIQLELANLMLRVANGEITVGEPVLPSAIAARREGEYLVPEWGLLTEEGGSVAYEFKPNPHIEIKAHQETFPSGNYVEVLCLLPEGVGEGYAERLAAGRAQAAPFTVLLDLLFGERLLGPVLTEEVGELFDDWHWNRQLGNRSVGLESQAKLEPLDGNAFLTKLTPLVDRFTTMNDETRQRVRMAAQWYWRAEIDPDDVLQFVSYWLVIEALELGEKANVSPVKLKMADILGVAPADVARQIGLLYSIRNKLLHGKLRVVPKDKVAMVRTVATALLEEHALGAVSEARTASLRTVLGLPVS